jgi:predicted transcriptional regulator with HTH domain
MPRISKEKQEKIQEQVLFFLYSIFPKQVFTADIAKEIARDEEFIKVLMLELEKNSLVVKVTKNSEGVNYERRLRWRISNNAYEIYNQHQNKSSQLEIQEKLEG